MLSTKTIILIIVGLVILFFIYNSMKKCEGLDGSSLNSIPICNYIDIKSQLQALEDKLKQDTGRSNITVSLRKIDDKQYFIDFYNTKYSSLYLDGVKIMSSIPINKSSPPKIELEIYGKKVDITNNISSIMQPFSAYNNITFHSVYRHKNNDIFVIKF